MTLDNILVVKLADLGDVLLSEPAIRSLRTAFPDARIDVLTTPAAAPLVGMFGHDVNVVEFRKHDFDSLSLRGLGGGSLNLIRLVSALQAGRYDAAALLHYLTTPAGAMKFRALAVASGAPRVAGLDNGRGSFLTHPVTDLGFGARHVVDDMLRVAARIGGNAVNPAPRLAAMSEPAASLSTVPDDPYAVIFPVTGPFAPGRNWPAESFSELAHLLSKRGVQPVIAGAADAFPAASVVLERVPAVIDLTGRTTLPQVAGLIGGAAVTIAGDSFPGHLAAALDAPLVAIFGPSNHRAWAPYGAVEPQAVESGNRCIIRNDVPCSPCLYTGFRLGRRAGCESRICLTSITPADVLLGVDAVIGKRA